MYFVSSSNRSIYSEGEGAGGWWMRTRRTFKMICVFYSNRVDDLIVYFRRYSFEEENILRCWGATRRQKKEEENPPRGRGCREKTKKSILPVLTRCFQYTKSGQVNDLPPCPLICEGFSSVLSSVFRDKKLEKIFSSSTPPGS